MEFMKKRINVKRLHILVIFNINLEKILKNISLIFFISWFRTNFLFFLYQSKINFSFNSKEDGQLSVIQ